MSKIRPDPVLTKPANSESDSIADAHAQRSSEQFELSMGAYINPHTRTLHAIMVADPHASVQTFILGNPPECRV